VRDGEGRLFAGTTTGGTMKKPDGRIGDAPIIGAGVFADDEVCGLSASGHGEAILKSLISGYIIADIRSFLRADSTRFEKDPELLKKILISELNDMRRRHPGQDAGFIVIPKKGAPSYAFNSLAMPVAVRHGSAEKIEFEEVQFAQR
jgi:beta-aspartyl-peptidase (threonine type)